MCLRHSVHYGKHHRQVTLWIFISFPRKRPCASWNRHAHALRSICSCGAGRTSTNTSQPALPAGIWFRKRRKTMRSLRHFSAPVPPVNRAAACRPGKSAMFPVRPCRTSTMNTAGTTRPLRSSFMMKTPWAYPAWCAWRPCLTCPPLPLWATFPCAA